MKRFIAIALTAVMPPGLATAAWADNAHFLFADIDEPQPDLYVAKSVSTATEGYTAPDSEFTFVLKWDQDGDGYLEFAENERYYVYNEDGSQVYNESTGSYIFRTNSSGRFTLKAGQYARFEWAGQVEYEVTELATQDFIQTSPAGGQAATGTVEESGTYLTFENTYIPPSPGEDPGEESTQLIIRKDIAWIDGYEVPDLSDTEFTFVIKIDGELYANEAYDVYDAGVTTKRDSGRTDSDGILTMTGDSAIVFPDVEVGVDYSVAEMGVDGWRATGQTSYAGATTSPMVYTYFANETTSFVIEKERSDGITGLDDAFTFLLTEESGEPVAGASYYLYDTNGALLSEMLSTDEEGKFTLQAGERALFVGIAADAAYKVVEENTNGYTVDKKDGYEGTVGFGSMDPAVFVNAQLSDITIKKFERDFSKKLLGGAKFTLYKLREGVDPDSATEEDWEPYPNEQNATKTTDDNEGSDTYGSLTFAGLPAGTYKIVETEAPEGYKAYGEPIIVTLPYTMTESEVANEHVDVDADDFTGLYSDRDGVYYFYELTYDVYNTHNMIEMPNTGGNAWIILVLAICGGAVAMGCVYLYRRRHSGKEKIRV